MTDTVCPVRWWAATLLLSWRFDFKENRGQLFHANGFTFFLDVLLRLDAAIQWRSSPRSTCMVMFVLFLSALSEMPHISSLWFPNRQLYGQTINLQVMILICIFCPCSLSPLAAWHAGISTFTTVPHQLLVYWCQHQGHVTWNRSHFNQGSSQPSPCLAINSFSLTTTDCMSVSSPLTMSMCQSVLLPFVSGFKSVLLDLPPQTLAGMPWPYSTLVLASKTGWFVQVWI